MQTLEVLIEENASGSVRPVELVADAPVSALVPALVEELQLPQTDLFGKKLVYTLRQSPDGQVISEDSTLVASGVQPGDRLALDSYVLDGTADPLAQRAPVFQPEETFDPLAQRQSAFQPQEAFDPFVQRKPAFQPEVAFDSFAQGDAASGSSVHSDVTIADAGPFAAGAGRSARGYGGAAGRGNTSDIDLPPLKKERRLGRRLFLMATGTVLVAGGAGLGYAGYRAYMNGQLGRLMSLGGQAATNAPNTMTTPTTAAPTKPALPTTAKLLLTFNRHKDDIRVVTWTADGKTLASSADDAHVFVWGPNGAVLRDIPHNAPVTALAWSPDGQRLVTGAGTRVAFYNLAGTVLAQSTVRHTQTVMSLAWTGHNHMQVVSGGADQRVVVWNTTNYDPQITYTLHTTAVQVVSWAPDGQTVASSSLGGAVRVWNAANGHDLHGYYQDTAVPVRALSFAQNDQRLAAGGNDGVVRIWNNGAVCGNAGAICRDVPQRFQPSHTAIRAVSWSPDGRILGVGADDGAFSLWDPANLQKPLLKITIQPGIAVHSIAWSPDRKQLATASGSMVRLWALT